MLSVVYQALMFTLAATCELLILCRLGAQGRKDHVPTFPPGTSPWPGGESRRPEHLRAPLLATLCTPSCAIEDLDQGGAFREVVVV